MDHRSAAVQAAVEYTATSNQGVKGVFQAAERALDDLFAWGADNPIAVVAGLGLIAVLALRRPHRR